MAGTNMLFRDDFSYSSHSQHYRGIYSDVYSRVMAQLEEYLSQDYPSVKCHCFTVADFGTADGSMVLPLFDDVIEKVHQHYGSSHDIQLVFEDQPSNNFNEMFKKINAWKPRCSGNIFTLASGTSMFRQCLPRETLDFGLTFTAMHWLNRHPTNIAQGISQFDASAKETKLMRKQSEIDYLHFLKCRSEELKPGGIVFVSCPAWLDSESGNPMDKLPGLVLKCLLQSKQITEEEYKNTNIHLYCRSKEEFQAPFKPEQTQTHRLQMIDFKIKVRSLIPLLSMMQNNDKTLRTQQAELVTNALKAFLFNSVYSGLSSHRSDSNKEQVCEAFFQKMRDNLVDSQFPAHLRIVSAEFFLKKI